jgi:hypothetical protein
MPAENQGPSFGSTSSSGQDESARAQVEPVRPAVESSGVSIVRWSQRHSEAAKAARVSAATRLSNGYVTEKQDRGARHEPASAFAPDSIVGWSRRHSKAAKVPVAGQTAASEPAESRAGRSRPARPASQGIVGRSRRGFSRAGDVRLVLRRSATLIALLGWLVALVMVVYILFVVLRANPLNLWAAYVETWAPRMNLGLGDLVSGLNPGIKVPINYGIAAILWAVIGTGVSWLIRRIAAR